jgi:hypothetical protein
VNAAFLLMIGQLLVKYGPGTVQAIVNLFHAKPEDITPQKWAELFDIAETEYQSYIKVSPRPAPPGIPIPARPNP